jgi:hypothetical protein
LENCRSGQQAIGHKALLRLALALSVGLCLGLSSLSLSAQQMLITFRSPESGSDQRTAYTNALLTLALDKTLATHGPYEIKLAPAMNKRRTISSVSTRAYPNFFALLAFDESYKKAELEYLPLPVHMGVLGYRICFTAPGLEADIAKVKTLDDLRRYSVGQGVGWSDVNILRANGFKVVEVAAYDSLFAMLSRGRFDLLCRGVNEVQSEKLSHPDLHLDQSFALFYPLPIFFYTHRDNRAAIERVAAGLQLAFDDGSMHKLFKQYYLESIQLANLHKRRLFRLSNPLLQGLDVDYRRYDMKVIDGGN